jgi:hypothetical protein
MSSYIIVIDWLVVFALSTSIRFIRQALALDRNKSNKVLEVLKSWGHFRNMFTVRNTMQGIALVIVILYPINSRKFLVKLKTGYST